MNIENYKPEDFNKKANEARDREIKQLDKTIDKLDREIYDLESRIFDLKEKRRQRVHKQNRLVEERQLYHYHSRNGTEIPIEDDVRFFENLNRLK